MQPRPSKKARFNLPLVTPETLYSANSPSKIQHLQPSPGSGFFPSSPPLPPFNQSSPLSSEPSLPFPEPACLDWRRPQPQRSARQSSPIGSEGALHLLLAACERAEKEKEAEIGELSEEENSEQEENETFTHTALSSEGSLSGDSSEEESSSDEEGSWEVDPDSLPARRSSWLDTGNTPYAKEKLVKILAGEVPIPKQRWSLRKILATLLYHRKDKRSRVEFTPVVAGLRGGVLFGGFGL